MIQNLYLINEACLFRPGFHREKSINHLFGHQWLLTATGVSIDGVHRYEVWLEDSHGFPTKVVSYDSNDREMETVMMDALVFNLHFPADFFTP